MVDIKLQVSKYSKYVYTLVTFIAALLVLFICVAIIAVSALSYNKVNSIIATINQVQTTVENLINEVQNISAGGVFQIIVGLIEAILKYLGLIDDPAVATYRTDMLAHFEEMSITSVKQAYINMLMKENSAQQAVSTNIVVPSIQSSQDLLSWVNSELM
jgi:hypothetical protein